MPIKRRTPTTRRSGAALAAAVLLALIASPGCRTLSECVEDESVGMNGGFEHARSGLPVNWLVYSPATVPSADFDVLFDREDFKEGRQSLHFSVRECTAGGGWTSPGITREYPAVPGATYRVSYWIKSEGAEYVVTAGGVSAKGGRTRTVDAADGADGAPGAWRLVDVPVEVPQPYARMRFELSIRSPGELWIDDVRIERIDGEGPGHAAGNPV